MPPQHFLGHPPGTRRHLRRSLGCALGCLPFALLPAAAGTVWFLLLCQRWRTGDFVRFVGCAAVFFIGVLVLAEAFRPPRLTMDFEPRLEGARLWFGLRALTTNWVVLEELAERAGEVPLSACGHEETPGAGEAAWHDPEVALATVRGIQRALAARSGAVDEAAAIAGELQLLEDALVKAVDQRCKFRLSLSEFCPDV